MKYRVAGVERRGELLLAVILKQKDDKQEVYLEVGEKVSLSITKTIYNFSTIEASDEKSMKLALAELRSQFSKETIDLGMLWEGAEDKRGYNVQKLLELYFGGYTERNAGTLLVALAQDSCYFEWRDGLFYKYPQAMVEATLHRERVQRERRGIEANLIAWLKGSLRGFDLSHDIAQKFLESLKKFALEGEASAPVEGKRLAQQLELDPDGLLTLLEQKGILSPDVNEALYRFQIPADFPAEARAEAQHLTGKESDLSGRRQLKDIWSIAIDDAETEEVDDAITYHLENGLRVVGVHIADVAATIPAGGPLDKFARERFATLYFPEVRMPLFPYSLVKKKLTLAAQQGRPTISGFFHFDAAGNLVNSQFEQTALFLNRRGTYEESLYGLGQEPEFRQVYEITAQLRDKRVKAGALVAQTPDLRIKVKDGKVNIYHTQMNLPAHNVVSELMILFNCALAEKFANEKIPGLFRAQAPKAESESIVLNQEDPLYPLKIRWVFGGAFLSTTPAWHASLAVNAYIQATSPIRRYSDLLMHRQLIALLNQQPLPYSEAALQEVKPTLEKAEKAVKTVELSRNLFWIYKYLQANPGKVYQAFVSRVLENQKVMVFLPELLQEFPYLTERLADAVEGKALSLKVVDAQPRQKRVQWALVVDSNPL